MEALADIFHLTRLLQRGGAQTLLRLIFQVVNTGLAGLPDDATQQVAPDPNLLPAMVQRGWLGNKSGQGFYKRMQTETGREFHELNYHNLEYQPHCTMS